MAKQMDRLLEGIERTGGFKDASVTYLKKSVETLEEGLWNLSERCTMWRVSSLDFLMFLYVFIAFDLSSEYFLLLSFIVVVLMHFHQ